MSVLFDLEEPKPKRDQSRSDGGHYSQHGRPDDFQTPPEGVTPLLPFLPVGSRIWEPSCGKGSIVRTLTGAGFDVCGTDIKSGEDFLTFTPSEAFDVIVTNPPFSLKEEFLTRCYEIGKPFALLMPLTALEGKKRQALYRRHGLELLMFPYRVNFETPSGKYARNGSSAWFPCAWFTHGLNLPSPIHFWQGGAEQCVLFSGAEDGPE